LGTTYDAESFTNNNNPDLGAMVAGKQEIEPQKLALDSLNAIIMDNKAMIHQSRATIEENRLLILSNQSAAALGNQ
jgi:hypothetical protein